MANEIRGLKTKYHITKADGSPAKGRYFVLKIDSKDGAHAKACRAAVLMYAEMIRDHLPELSENLTSAIWSYRRMRGWELWDAYLGRSDHMQDWEPEACTPGCPGVAVFDGNFVPPRGWVHIERCDDCDRFPHDQAAAEWLTDEVGFVCIDCPAADSWYERKVMTEEEANAHEHDHFRVVIPEDSARAAVSHGKLRQWWPDD